MVKDELGGEKPDVMITLSRVAAAPIFHEARYCCWESVSKDDVVVCEFHYDKLREQS